MWTVEQVRDSFSNAGFEIQPAFTWDWTSPPVTTFQIRDRASARVLMALVYPTAAMAQAARVQGQAQELALNHGSVSSGNNPHLLPSYGTSVWAGNVALVQTLRSDLDRAFQLQSDRDNCVDTADPNLTLEPDPPAYAVDLDFQRALSNTSVSL